MKQLLFGLLLFLIACGNKGETDTSSEGKTTTEKNEAAAENPNAKGDDITGEWELVGIVRDTNDNLQIDEPERKDIIAASYQDYMMLNSNGTGVFTIGKMDGRYEITESNGKKFLTWYDKGDGRHRVGTIVYVSKDELHIKEPGGNGLILWKRL